MPLSPFRFIRHVTISFITVPSIKEKSGMYVFPFASSAVFIMLKRLINKIAGAIKNSKGAARAALVSLNIIRRISLGNNKNAKVHGVASVRVILNADEMLFEMEAESFFLVDTVGNKTVVIGAIIAATRFSIGVTKVE